MEGNLVRWDSGVKIHKDFACQYPKDDKNLLSQEVPCKAAPLLILGEMNEDVEKGAAKRDTRRVRDVHLENFR
jgi:hypothetical protein